MRCSAQLNYILDSKTNKNVKSYNLLKKKTKIYPLNKERSKNPLFLMNFKYMNSSLETEIAPIKFVLKHTVEKITGRHNILIVHSLISSKVIRKLEFFCML